MIRRQLKIVALALATLAAAACTNPTGPSAKAPRVSHDGVEQPTTGATGGSVTGSSI